MIREQFKNAFSCTNRKYIYICASLRAFSMSMIELFVPIYLYVSGYSLKEVAIFLLIQEIVYVIYSFVGMKIIGKVGLEKSYIFSFVPLCIYFFFISNIEQLNISIYLLPLLGQFVVFYWLWHHISLAKYTKEGSRNSQTVMAQTLSSFVSILGPIIGGSILTYLGVEYLIIVVLFFLSASAFFMSQFENVKENFTYISFFEDIKRIDVKQYVSLISRGITVMFHYVVWPLLAYILYLNDYVLLGISSGLLALSAIFAGHFASSAFDKNERLGLRIGGVGLSAIWAIRMLAIGPLGVFITSFFEGILEKLAGVSFNAISYTNAEKISLLNYTLVREICIHLGCVIVCISLLLVSDWLKLLPLAVISNLLYFLF